MYELSGLHTDVMRAELAYRRDRINPGRRIAPTGGGRWLRARRRPAQAPTN